MTVNKIHNFKIGLVGDAATGKTVMTDRFANFDIYQNFNKEHDS